MSRTYRAVFAITVEARFEGEFHANAATQHQRALASLKNRKDLVLDMQEPKLLFIEPAEAVAEGASPPPAA